MESVDLKAVHDISRDVVRSSVQRAHLTASQVKAHEWYRLQDQHLPDGTKNKPAVANVRKYSEPIHPRKTLGPYSKMLIAHADLYAKPSDHGNTSQQRPEDTVPKYPYTRNLLNAVIYALADDPEPLCYELTTVAEECRRLSAENEGLKRQIDETAQFSSPELVNAAWTGHMSTSEANTYLRRPNSSPSRKKGTTKSKKKANTGKKSSGESYGDKNFLGKLSDRNAATLAAYSKAGMEKKQNIDKKIAERKKWSDYNKLGGKASEYVLENSLRRYSLD